MHNNINSKTKTKTTSKIYNKIRDERNRPKFGQPPRNNFHFVFIFSCRFITVIAAKIFHSFEWAAISSYLLESFPWKAMPQFVVQYVRWLLILLQLNWMIDFVFECIISSILYTFFLKHILPIIIEWFNSKIIGFFFIKWSIECNYNKCFIHFSANSLSFCFGINNSSRNVPAKSSVCERVSSIPHSNIADTTTFQWLSNLISICGINEIGLVMHFIHLFEQSVKSLIHKMTIIQENGLKGHGENGFSIRHTFSLHIERRCYDAFDNGSKLKCKMISMHFIRLWMTWQIDVSWLYRYTCGHFAT